MIQTDGLTSLILVQKTRISGPKSTSLLRERFELCLEKGEQFRDKGGNVRQ